MAGESLALRKAEEILARYPGEFISRRDGLVTIKIVDNGQTVIVWIRQSPITENALNAFKKLIARHKYDRLVLLKLYNVADFVKLTDLTIFNEVKHNDY